MIRSPIQLIRAEHWRILQRLIRSNLTLHIAGSRKEVAFDGLAGMVIVLVVVVGDRPPDLGKGGLRPIPQTPRFIFCQMRYLNAVVFGGVNVPYRCIDNRLYQS